MANPSIRNDRSRERSAEVLTADGREATSNGERPSGALLLPVALAVAATVAFADSLQVIHLNLVGALL